MPFYVDESGSLSFRSGSGGPGGGSGLYAAGRGVGGGVGVSLGSPLSGYGALAAAPAAGSFGSTPTIGSSPGLPAPQLGGMFLPFAGTQTARGVAEAGAPPPPYAPPFGPPPLRQSPVAEPGRPAANPWLSMVPASGYGSVPDVVDPGVSRPPGVPAPWTPRSTTAPPSFAGPAGWVPPGLREPFGDSTPVKARDLGFAITGFDRTWGLPPPLDGMYAGLVWNPDRQLFEAGPSLRGDHWYRKLVDEGIYIQSYQDDETEPGVWKQRYIRTSSAMPELGHPYAVLGPVHDLYREKQIRDYEAADKAATEAIHNAYKSDNSLVARLRRGEIVKEADYKLPEKYRLMEIKKEPVLLPMPLWSVISKATVEKMYRDAGLPVPEMPGEAAVANNQAFQDFKEVRGHDQKSSAFFIPAEEQWDAQEEARRQRLKEQREAEKQARIDRINAGVREPAGGDDSGDGLAEVPDVEGMTEKQATATLRAAGLDADVPWGKPFAKAAAQPEPDKIVSSQSIHPGTRTTRGSFIRLTFWPPGMAPGAPAPKPGPAPGAGPVPAPGAPAPSAADRGVKDRPGARAIDTKNERRSSIKSSGGAAIGMDAPAAGPGEFQYAGPRAPLPPPPPPPTPLPVDDEPDAPDSSTSGRSKPTPKQDEAPEPKRNYPPPTATTPSKRTGNAVVPYVTNMSLAAARNLLKDFSPLVSGPDAETTTVWAQHPVAGTTAPINSPVALVTTLNQGGENKGILPGPKPTLTAGQIRVPDVRLLSPAEARARLAGFSVFIKGVESATAVVITQSPAGGTWISLGNPVILAIGVLGRDPDPGTFSGITTNAGAANEDPRPTPGANEDPCAFWRRMSAWAKRHPGEGATFSKPRGCDETATAPSPSVVAAPTPDDREPPRPGVPAPVFASKVRVPEVVGLTAIEAERRLTLAGLHWEYGSSRRSDDPEPRVGSQFPSPQTLVDGGSTIFLEYERRYAPPSFVEVPRLIGKSLAQANAALVKVGLVARESGPGAVVVAQRPSATQVVGRGSIVDVEMGAEAGKVEVPNVRHMTFDGASTLLRSVGLILEPDLPPEGATVYWQEPPAGTEVVSGAIVRILLWKMTVPNVVDLTLDAAKDSLRLHGLGVSVRGNASTRDSVVKTQVDPPGSERDRNWPVGIYMSGEGPELVHPCKTADSVGVLLLAEISKARGVLNTIEQVIHVNNTLNQRQRQSMDGLAGVVFGKTDRSYRTTSGADKLTRISGLYRDFKSAVQNAFYKIEKDELDSARRGQHAADCDAIAERIRRLLALMTAAHAEIEAAWKIYDVQLKLEDKNQGHIPSPGDALMVGLETAYAAASQRGGFTSTRDALKALVLTVDSDFDLSVRGALTVLSLDPSEFQFDGDIASLERLESDAVDLIDRVSETDALFDRITAVEGDAAATADLLIAAYGVFSAGYNIARLIRARRSAYGKGLPKEGSTGPSPQPNPPRPEGPPPPDKSGIPSPELDEVKTSGPQPKRPPPTPAEPPAKPPPERPGATKGKPETGEADPGRKRSAPPPPRNMFKYRVQVPASDANARYANRPGWELPHGDPCFRCQLAESESGWVRVYRKDVNDPKGSWFMRKSDIEGLSPRQIKERWGLPEVPDRVVDATFEPGARFYESTARPTSYGAGGGVQREFLSGEVRVDTRNSRPLTTGGR